MDPADYVIAVQVRNGASRLPDKMSRRFFEEQTIPELLLRRLTSTFPASRVVLATSTVAGDGPFQELAKQVGVRCHHGSETDVLGRVAEAVQDDGARFVVRVCGDNPFLLAAGIQDLLKLADETDCEYASFRLTDGTPTILSHLGLYAEVVRTATLFRLYATATQPRHREHLTSGILDAPTKFQCEFIEVPPALADQRQLRLTVDTETDFLSCQRLYQMLDQKPNEDPCVDSILKLVQDNPELQSVMAREIASNEKQ